MEAIYPHVYLVMSRVTGFISRYSSILITLASSYRDGPPLQEYMKQRDGTCSRD